MDVFKGLVRSVNVGTSVRVGLLLLVGLLVSFQLSVVAAQETPEAEPTGKLVLVPDDLYVGETTDVLGFHLEYPDKAITIGYSNHFVPAGESCDSAEAGTSAFTAPPARISLTACTAGEGRVQLKETDTGTVIAEATATITVPQVTERRAPRSCHELTGVICSPNAPTGLKATAHGQRDISVTWKRLIGATKYEVEREEVGASDDPETFEVTSTGKTFIVDPGTEHSFRVRAFGNGTTWTEEWGLWSAKVRVTTETPPTMSIRVESGSPSSITEGRSAQFTLRSSPAPSFSAILIKIDITQEGDFLAPSQSTIVRLSKNSTTVDRSISTTNDSTCEDDGSVTVTIGEHDEEKHQTYNIGSPSSASVAVEDNDNCPPELTNPTRRVAYPENGTSVVATYTATDPENDDLTFSISGLDAGDFDIDPDSGELDFEEPPDYENPEDRGRINVYNVTVRVRDNGSPRLSDSVDVEVTVTNRSPTITSGPSSRTYSEGGTDPVGGYVASDPGGGTIVWDLLGADLNQFSISPRGVLSFRNTPDYEIPVDSNHDNVYKVTVRASDRRLSDIRNVTITVENRRPTITSGPFSVNYAEGGTDSVGNYVARDPGGGAIAWSLSGTDQLDFSITGGELKFAETPDFENPVDSGTDNEYHVTVSASDSRLIASRNVTVTVTDVEEGPDKVTGLTGTSGSIGGTIDLDWDPADRADDYEVAEWRRRVLLPFTYHWVILDDSEVTIDASDTTAVVTGLEGGETYRHRVRGVRGVGTDRVEGPWSDHMDTILTLPDKVTGVTGTPGSDHMEISLSWTADPEATGYQVRQKKPRTFPLPDTWIVLPDEGFGLMVTGNTAVVSNLDPDKTYVYQVRGTNVHGEGDWSEESAAIAVHDERPDIPQGLMAKDIKGGRGIIVEWKNVTGADEYEVERSYSVERPTKNKTSELYIGFIELMPGIEYTFRVRACKKQGASCLYSPWSRTVDREAPTPTHYWGHQHDHTAAYSIAKNSRGDPDIGVPAIDAVILTAISDWNARMNYGLRICDISASNCSDMHVASIKTVAPAGASDNVTGCGPSYACVIRTGPEENAPNGVGLHMTAMDVIFEDIANTCAKNDAICPSNEETTFEWTNNDALDDMPVDPLIPNHRYIYAKWVVLHELGHTLGLPDFYGKAANTNYDARLANEKAIMNQHWEAKTIQDADIEQLDAIYRIHSN